MSLDQITSYWFVFGPVITLLVPFMTAYAAPSAVKKAVTVVLVALVVVAAVLSQAWDGITMEVAVERAAMLWALAEASYRVLNPMVDRAAGRDLGELPMFFPGRGLGSLTVGGG